ncbi:polyphosphate--glucose phosphotransferase [Arthrobacter mobilis]|uniref:ROK family protein n=1 Tax=Arthrobacter mobilis TaxID=2724944 RepID=A0A7X6HDF7_9MICC|nr:ROK family protein [Arthrobacter mobilis]NKX54495.1 ROK family protein [Arthrobacter mobilis]
MTTLAPLSQGLPGAQAPHGHRIGIDVGGTGIKYAVVDTTDGTLAGPLRQIPTPQPATPGAVADLLAQLVVELTAEAADPQPALPVGVALPAIIRHGVARSAANIDRGWIGLDANALFARRLRRRTQVINDADAAGLAEVRYGAGRGSTGVVLVITLGTGIGSALFVEGRLLPNTELGHLEIGGFPAETRASAVARELEGLDWKDYAGRLQQYLSHVEFLFSPDLIIVGGGISARCRDFLPHLDLRTRIIPAELRNAAGVVGAAVHGLQC